MTNNFIIIILIWCFAIRSIYLQVIPHNPCPHIFKYVRVYGQIHGRVKFKNDNSGAYRLVVNMSVAYYLGNDQKINLELKTAPMDILKGAPLVYNVYFPNPYVIPKPTLIKFNGRIYCSSPPEEGGYVTNFWAKTFFKFTHNHGSSVKPQFPFDSFETQPVTQPDIITQYTMTPEVQTRATISSISTTEAPFKPTPPPVDYSECGRPSIIPIHLVTDEEDVADGQYPWMTAIMFRLERQYELKCTGNLVSDRHVITAGHCLQYGQALLFQLEDLIVVLGTNSLKNWILMGVIRGVIQVFTHPNYVQDSAENDVTVVTLNKPIEFTKNVRPICLWQNESTSLEEIVGKKGVIAGWGRELASGEYSLDAKRINLPVLSTNECLKSNLTIKSSVRTFCAGKKDANEPCLGDSGAGFAMFQNGRWLLRGVIAFSDSETCSSENYLVFADLANIKGWISSVLK